MKKSRYDWKPPKIGAKQDNEVTCYGFGLGEPPYAKSTMDILEKLQGMNGFVGVYPNLPYGIAIIYKTKKDAEMAYRYCERNEYKVGKGVGECYVDKEFVDEGGDR